MQSAKKKQRVSSSSRLSSLAQWVSSPVHDHRSEPTRVEFVELDTDGKLKKGSCNPLIFNDPAVADVVLFLHTYNTDIDDREHCSSTEVYLHACALEQCKYFATVLSERWQESRQFSEGPNHEKRIHINMTIPGSRAIDSYLLVLQLLYCKDFKGLIKDVSTALSCLPVAAEWLYDECIAACVQYLEAVPWTEEEEKRVLDVVTSLQLRESAQLLARITPVNTRAVHDMLGELVYAAIHSHPNGATVKAFVARLLNDHSSRSTVKLVLDGAFANSLKTVKDSVEEYSSPNVRGRHDEIEALQRVSLHTASLNSKHLLWLVERMIELRVADKAVSEWSEQVVFTANLLRVFNDDAWRTIAPSLPALVLRCTFRLASAVAAGSMIATCQVRKKLVEYWLPVLLVSRETPSHTASSLKLQALHQDLEDVFLRIISTLPLEDAQKLLPQCLSFATRSVEDCPHLMAAFNLWFRRASSDDRNGVTYEEEDILSM
ncbi:hypothetical protein KP509_26G014300 [Ceratopteris richardii]|uniref:At3g05675-like ankyrin-like domain-containing protein n=1 Tax=Ceratopteris richardii TaxID=49495 RepID=A0A8T2RK94_CERRI|nr:hypothetical protein KP509_26G014300 [Ceratopteris richardii]